MKINWISVRDRLPKNNPRKRLLICYRNASHYSKSAVAGAQRRAGRVILFAIYSGDAWRFLDLRDKSRLSERVTHWSPLPFMPPRRAVPLQDSRK